MFSRLASFFRGSRRVSGSTSVEPAPVEVPVAEAPQPPKPPQVKREVPRPPVVTGTSRPPISVPPNVEKTPREDGGGAGEVPVIKLVRVASPPHALLMRQGVRVASVAPPTVDARGQRDVPSWAKRPTSPQQSEGQVPPQQSAPTSSTPADTPEEEAAGFAAAKAALKVAFDQLTVKREQSLRLWDGIDARMKRANVGCPIAEQAWVASVANRGESLSRQGSSPNADSSAEQRSTEPPQPPTGDSRPVEPSQPGDEQPVGLSDSDTVEFEKWTRTPVAAWVAGGLGAVGS